MVTSTDNFSMYKIIQRCQQQKFTVQCTIAQLTIEFGHYWTSGLYVLSCGQCPQL